MHEHFQDSPQHKLCVRFATSANQVGGRALLVGGAVRDHLLGAAPKDCDVELFGVAPDRVEPLLREVFQHVKPVGRSFPVWKAWTDDTGQEAAVDVALPRREVRTGPKHTDFKVDFDPHMDFAEASARRDFTINAIGRDLITSEIIDPHHGLEDLAARRLRHVSHRFSEDPLRVLRGAQFVARFDLAPAPETIALCRTLEPSHLSAERILGEWSKLLLKGERPSAGLEFLRQAEWIRFFPELAALIGVQQDPGHHPEGDVWAHTLHCVDAYARTRTGVERDDLVAGLAVLCHDFGKASMTQFSEGKWRAHGHEAAGEEPARSFLRRMTDDASLIEDVVRLVVRHMVPKSFYALAQRAQNMDRSVRRLATEVRLDQLARVCFCDDAGRPPKPAVSPVAEWLREAAGRLNVTQHKPTPFVQGRDLIAAGECPGPHWGPILKQVYSLQIDEIVRSKEEALAVAILQLRAPEHKFGSPAMIQTTPADIEGLQRAVRSVSGVDGPSIG